MVNYPLGKDKYLYHRACDAISVACKISSTGRKAGSQLGKRRICKLFLVEVVLFWLYASFGESEK